MPDDDEEIDMVLSEKELCSLIRDRLDHVRQASENLLIYGYPRVNGTLDYLGRILAFRSATE